MLNLLDFFTKRDDTENQLRNLQKCIMHALSVRELNPDLKEMTINAFLEVILSQQIDD